MFDGKQSIAIASGPNINAFALPRLIPVRTCPRPGESPAFRQPCS